MPCYRIHAWVHARTCLPVHVLSRESLVMPCAVCRVPSQDFVARKGRPGWSSTVYGHAALLGQGVREALRNGTYRPVLDPATEACRTVLPWWREATQQQQQQQQQADPG